MANRLKRPISDSEAIDSDSVLGIVVSEAKRMVRDDARAVVSKKLGE